MTIHSVIELCTEDVLLIPPTGSPIVGRKALTEWLQHESSDVISVDSEIRLLRGNETMAYKIAAFSSTSRVASTGEVLTSSGSHLWILERSTEGKWRVALLTWMLTD
ncbi:MAG TPA: DUF4440 domain-containing protein [Pyrinomonadaceae bacterium]|nr:DUF4440 domain-containing protein [Pyrinomonadaceae bacterium]